MLKKPRKPAVAARARGHSRIKTVQMKKSFHEIVAPAQRFSNVKKASTDAAVLCID
jgi:hypothetical protein